MAKEATLYRANFKFLGALALDLDQKQPELAKFVLK